MDNKLSNTGNRIASKIGTCPKCIQQLHLQRLSLSSLPKHSQSPWHPPRILTASKYIALATIVLALAHLLFYARVYPKPFTVASWRSGQGNRRVVGHSRRTVVRFSLSSAVPSSPPWPLRRRLHWLTASTADRQIVRHRIKLPEWLPDTRRMHIPLLLYRQRRSARIR